MGRKSITGGVIPKADRIQLDFAFQGKRFRPTIDLAPTQANLKHARRRLEEIKRRIASGSFNFAEEFPEYRFIGEVGQANQARTVDEVCEAYITSLRARDELAFATVESYRKILKHHVQPHIGANAFAAVQFSKLEEIANRHQGSKKTFNNVVSAIRGAWRYGYKDLSRQRDPALGLECVRIPKREQPKPDPFNIDDAEILIKAIAADWGEAQGNYDEFRFFTGLRPSEEIALNWADVDFDSGELAVNKARVMGRDKSETKNYEDRVIELCPRALTVLLRQRALYSRLKLAGKIDHDRIFFRKDGQPFHDIQLPWRCWRRTLLTTLKMRERDPYSARHSSVSWNLMMGKNLLWVAEQHGHSAAVMLKTYARWMKGATEKDIEKIRSAFGFVTDLALAHRAREAISLTQYGNVLAEREGFEPSIPV